MDIGELLEFEATDHEIEMSPELVKQMEEFDRQHEIWLKDPKILKHTMKDSIIFSIEA